MSAAVVEPSARVLIAAERRPVRARLRHALEGDAACSEAETADAAVAAAVRERPDVCFIGLKGGSRMRAVTEILAQVPSAQVIVLTNRPDEDEFMAAMRGGAAGYLPQ